MAKQIHYVRLLLANGETRLIQTKTTTAAYIRRIIDDLILPANVMRYEVI